MVACLADRCWTVIVLLWLVQRWRGSLIGGVCAQWKKFGPLHKVSAFALGRLGLAQTKLSVTGPQRDIPTWHLTWPHHE